MSSSSPVVLVHAQLPTVRPGGPGYSDPSTWMWVPCLEFPIERVNQLQFSSKPLKWIRYCIGAVTGAHGDLSHQHDLLELVDYDQPLSSQSQSTAPPLYHSILRLQPRCSAKPLARTFNADTWTFLVETNIKKACEGLPKG
ncbi:hypothetical protein LXA43DRAFT_1143110 [Ganoderma leucocontextum]|nr:hypothetical protein LXA43DRAFT_1143110 [Ganoderma leucocontextum]